MIKISKNKLFDSLIFVLVILFSIPYIYIILAISNVGRHNVFKNDPSFYYDDIFKFIYALPVYGFIVVLIELLLILSKGNVSKFKIFVFISLIIFFFLLYYFDPGGYLFWFFD